MEADEAEFIRNLPRSKMSGFSSSGLSGGPYSIQSVWAKSVWADGKPTDETATVGGVPIWVLKVTGDDLGDGELRVSAPSAKSPPVLSSVFLLGLKRHPKKNTDGDFYYEAEEIVPIDSPKGHELLMGGHD